MSTSKMHADDINVSLVRRLIATQFSQWADLPVEPVEAGGWDNKTFHLGAHMTVRLPSAARYAPQVEKEHRWLPKLAPLLPLLIPVPLAMGVPADGYPWHWSVYRWLEGEVATAGRIADLSEFATTLAEFLTALYRIDPSHRRQHLRGHGRFHAPQIRPHHRGQGGSAGIVAAHAGHP